MRILRNSILLFLTFILAFTAPLLVFFQSISSTILKPYNTAAYLEKSGLYSDFEKAFEDDLKGKVGSVLDKHGNALTANFIKSIIEKQIADSSVSFIMEGASESIWDYILGKSDLIKPVAMNDLNRLLITLIGREAEDYSQKAGLPKDLLKQELTNYAEKNLPNYYNFMLAFNLQVEDIDNLKQVYFRTRQILFFLYMVVFSSLLIGLITAGNLKRISKWLSTNLIIGGFLSLVPSGILLLYKDDLFGKIRLNGLLNNFYNSFERLFGIVINDILIHIIIAAILLMLIGVGLLVLRVVLQNEEEERANIIVNK